MSPTTTQPKGSIIATVHMENGTLLEPIVIPLEFVGQLHTLIQAAILREKGDELLEAKANHDESQ